MIRTDPRISINKMTPSVWEYFRSFYYPATHLTSVDLDQDLQQHICPDPQILTNAQRAASLPGVQQVLSDTMRLKLDEILGKDKVSYPFQLGITRIGQFLIEMGIRASF